MSNGASPPARPAAPVAAILLAVVAFVAFCSPAAAPPPAAPPRWQKVDLTAGWRFKPDPANAGLGEGWAAPDYDDRAWARITTGHPWEEQGFPNYDGYGWYRRAITIPAGWRGLPLYLWLSGIDDEADVYVNGTLLTHVGDRATKQSTNRDQIPIDLGSVAVAGRTVLVAVRVNDWGGDGGLTMQPTALATSAVALYSDEQYVKFLFRRDRDLPWPYWMVEGDGALKPQGAAWTMVGTEGSTAKALLGLDSSLMPNQEGVVVTPWLYDRAAQQLHWPEPSTVHFTPAAGHLPLPTAVWDAPGLAVTSTIFVANSGAEPTVADPIAGDVVFYAVAVANAGETPRDLTLFLALRPYAVAGRLSPVYTLAQEDRAVLVNGRVAIVADRPPDGFGATSAADGDVGFFAKRGALPPGLRASDDRGLAGGALAYHLPLAPGAQITLTLKLPVVPADDLSAAGELQALDFAAQHDATMRSWRSRLGAIQLSLPDPRYADAYYASLANLYSARNGDLVLPGPLVHRRFWYRDAAYFSTALLRAGRADIVRPLLAKAIGGQLPSGEFPAILEPDGRPALPLKHEWDAQGEGIFALVSYYRWTQDRAWLREAYPTIRRAALFLRDLRHGELRADLQGTPAYGILPPSESAEDLGPATWHHYWDDFWALNGLGEAAFAARSLGEEEDAGWMEEERAALRGALLDSIRLVQQAKGINYVPNGPEDTDTPAMARGTTPALWPAPSFDAADPLLRRSFELYFERWIAPFGGAYRHEANNYWPYGGLQLANVYLLLGMPDKVQRILDWTLANQTLPGLYAWAESVLPATNRFAGGDMPHAWAAAEYTLLLRNMLVREEGDRLLLAGYLPPGWLADGQRLAIAGLPTLFGSAGYTLESHAAAGYWELSILPGAGPPAGYRWALPAGFAVDRVAVDGEDWHDYDGSGINLPPATRLIRLYGRMPPP